MATLRVTTRYGQKSVSSPMTDGVGTNCIIGGPDQIAFSGDGTFIAFADYVYEAVRLIDIATDMVTTLTSSALYPQFNFAGLECVTVSPDSSYILFSSYLSHFVFKVIVRTGITTIWIGNGAPRSIDGFGISASINGAGVLVFSPDGTYVLISQYDGHRISRVNVGTQELVTIAGSGAYGSYDSVIGLQASFEGSWGLAITPDSKFAVVGEYDGHRLRIVSIQASTAVVISSSIVVSGVSALHQADAASFCAAIIAVLGLPGNVQCIVTGWNVVLSDPGLDMSLGELPKITVDADITTVLEEFFDIQNTLDANDLADIIIKKLNDGDLASAYQAETGQTITVKPAIVTSVSDYPVKKEFTLLLKSIEFMILCT
jgi:WD40 repeat protein